MHESVSEGSDGCVCARAKRMGEHNVFRAYEFSNKISKMTNVNKFSLCRPFHFSIFIVSTWNMYINKFALFEFYLLAAL